MQTAALSRSTSALQLGAVFVAITLGVRATSALLLDHLPHAWLPKVLRFALMTLNAVYELSSPVLLLSASLKFLPGSAASLWLCVVLPFFLYGAIWGYFLARRFEPSRTYLVAVAVRYAGTLLVPACVIAVLFLGFKDS